MNNESGLPARATKNSGVLGASRYRVSFIAKEALDLPFYLGSTLRGAFGHAFRRIACPALHGACPIPAQCPYHLIFETSPPLGSEALRSHEGIPRPFVIAPATGRAQLTDQPGRQQFNPGDEVSFELVLIGRAQEFFPYFVVALREVDRIGRGRRTVELHRIEALSSCPSPLLDMRESPLGEAQRSRAEALSLPKGQESATCAYQREDAPVVSVEARIVYDVADNLVRGVADTITLEDCATLPMPQGPLTIEFVTQTRLKHEGSFIRHPGFQVVLRRLLGRLSSLARFHCGAPLEVDFRGLIDQAASIRLMMDGTKWTRWQRYSSRQDRRMEWEGIIGRANYEGEFAPFWKFLKFGELVHVGHSTTFGLGKYRVGEAV
jgi:CRISPR-associated endoribonuclease Cas6